MQHLRLKAHEKAAVEKKLFEINELLKEQGLDEVDGSMVLHEVIRQSLPKVTVSESGGIVLDLAS